jgi:hypothetical protein
MGKSSAETFFSDDDYLEYENLETTPGGILKPKKAGRVPKRAEIDMVFVGEQFVTF